MSAFIYLCDMLGLTLHSSTNTNELRVDIPDELKGIDLQIIIIPANTTEQQIEFFTSDELQQLSTTSLSTPLDDDEDYTKW